MARFFVLSAGALCVALAACSSGSDQGGSAGSWGGTSSSNGNGNGASGPTSPTGGNAGSSSGGGTPVDMDASTPGADSGRGDGGADAAVEAAPVEDTGSPANTFSLVDTNVTGVVYGQTISGYDPIANDAVIDLNKVGKALSIRANTMPTIVGHVDFVLDGTYTHTENAAPYFLCGDNGQGTINDCIQYFTNGKHMLTITPYALGSAPDAGPDAGAMPSSTLYFSVTDGLSDAGGGG